MTINISIMSTQGGCGVSVLAAALAIVASTDVGPIVIQDERPEDQVAIFGSHLPRSPGDELAPGIFWEGYLGSEPVALRILAGVDPMTDADFIDHLSVICFRGPCYLGLRRAATTMRTAGAIGVLMREEERSLGAREVTDVTGLRIVADYLRSAQVARAVDAGVFPVRMPPQMARAARRVLAETGAMPDHVTETAVDNAAAMPGEDADTDERVQS